VVKELKRERRTTKEWTVLNHAVIERTVADMASTYAFAFVLETDISSMLDNVTYFDDI